MESTLGNNGRSNDININAVTAKISDEFQRGRSVAGQEVSDLMVNVQDLLGRIAHVSEPDVARLRVKVQGALSSAKTALAQGSDRVQRQAKDVLNAGDGYVRDQPWQAAGIAAAVGLIVGFLVARR